MFWTLKTPYKDKFRNAFVYPIFGPFKNCLFAYLTLFPRVLATPVKKFKKLCYHILVPFKNATFLPVQHFSQGVPILLFFQNGLKSAQPLLRFVRTHIYKKF